MIPLIARVRLFLIILFTGLMISCEYQTDEVYYKNVEQPDWSDVVIDLNVANDTIYLYQTTTLDFSALLGKHKVKSAYAHLGDRTVLASGEGLYPIIIQAEYFTSGTYKLSLEVTVSSETGSLADLRNHEVMKIEREWTVIIDHEVPAKIHITSIEIKDNGLEIRWEPYKKPNFQYYRLTKYCYNEFYKYYERCWGQEFYSNNTVTMMDSSFVGGKANYVLSVAAANKLSDADEKSIEVKYDAELEYEWVNSQKIKLTWRKPAVDQNVGSYQISFSNDTDTRTFSTYNPNDTTIEIDGQMKFPAQKQILFTVSPKGANDYDKGNLYGFGTAIVGKYFPGFYKQSLVYNVALKKYFAMGYANNQTAVVMINPETHEVENSYPSREQMFALSENGMYLYVINGNKLIRLNPTDFSEIDSHDFTVDGWDPGIMKVSNSNLLLCERRAWNLNTMTLIPSLPTGVIEISPNGEYVLSYEKLYQYSGGIFQEITLPAPLGNWGGEFTSDLKLLSYSSNAIDVFDLSSMTLEKTIASPAKYLRLDPATGMIGGFSEDYSSGPRKFYVYSMDGLEQEIDIGYFTTQYGSMLLANDNLISSYGNIVPISWYTNP